MFKLHHLNALRWDINVDLEFILVLILLLSVDTLSLLTCDVFKAHFEDYHFDENIFSSLRKEKSLPEVRQEIIWNNSTLSHFDPRTNECELEAQRIIHLQSIANQLPDAFTNNKKIVKSHIPAASTPAKIEVPVS
jgi:hypothetical protein